MSKYIPLSEVTALAQTVVKTADNYDVNVWRAWVWQCVLNLGISDDEIKVCTLYPKDYIAKLPDDCRQVIEVALYDSEARQLAHVFRTGKRRVFTNQELMLTNEGQATNCVPVDISSDMHNLHLGTTGSDVTSIVVRYFSYPLDEKTGLPLIREEDAMACVYFIRYMQALRDDDNRSKIEQDKMAYYMEADRARARKKMESMNPDKARTVLGSMMSLIPNFRAIQNF